MHMKKMIIITEFLIIAVVYIAQKFEESLISADFVPQFSFSFGTLRLYYHVA